MYKNIVDPDTKKKFNIHSKQGFKILKRYILYGGTKIGVKIEFGDKRLTATSNKIKKTSDPTQTEVGIQHFSDAEEKPITLYYKRLTDHEYKEIKSKNLIEKWRLAGNLVESFPVDFSANEYKDFEIDELDEKIIYITNVNYTLAKKGKIDDMIYIHTNINRLYGSLLRLLYEQKLVYLDIKLQNIGCINDDNEWIFIDNESTIPTERGFFPVPIYLNHFYGIIPYDIHDIGGFQKAHFFEGTNIINDFKIKSLYILLLLVVVVEIYTGIRKECKLSTRPYIYLNHYKDILEDKPELEFWKDIYNIFLNKEVKSDEKWKNIVQHFEAYLFNPNYKITTSSESEPVRTTNSESELVRTTSSKSELVRTTSRDREFENRTSTTDRGRDRSRSNSPSNRGRDRSRSP